MESRDAAKEEQGSSGKRVVRVVRRVVRRVIPSGMEQQNQPPVSEPAKAASTAESGPKTTKGPKEDRDDISMGLTNLMGRVRTKEHRPRTRTQDRKEDVKEEVKQEEEREKVEEELEKCTMETEEAPSSGSPKSTISPPSPKADALAPPAGFIPAPRQSLLIPPPGFIPARKSSPVPPKHNTLARPPGFIPVTKTDPLAPPTGFIPKPRPLVVKKPEVLSEKNGMFPS